MTAIAGVPAGDRTANFARDVVEGADPGAIAIVELTREGGRREHTFGDVSRRAGSLAGRLASAGVGRGDVVMTLIGNRPEWVYAMVACFRLGAVVLPCTEQLRPKDLRHRIRVARPAAVVADPRNGSALRTALAGSGDIEVLFTDDPDLWAASPPPHVPLRPDEPCLLTFTSGTSGDPKAVLHVQRYLTGQRLQAEHWFGLNVGDVAWCTASTGWSKSARNAFIAPWLRGATAVLHDGRFDPAERLDLMARERVTVLCMAPTEYRIIAQRTDLRPLPHLRSMVAAGEALDPDVLAAWRDATGVAIRDGYGQTETGQLTGTPPGQTPRPGSMGAALPGVRLWIEAGELVVDPASVPTFFHGYLGEERPLGAWRTGDRVHEEDGQLFFEGRTDDVIVSAGYRIGPHEVESALTSHPAVADAAVIGVPDPERGSIVHAIVVLRGGFTASAELAASLQAHAKEQTAPYKYPRRVSFAEHLPRTTSGKVRRALLRESYGG